MKRGLNKLTDNEISQLAKATLAKMMVDGVEDAPKCNIYTADK